MRPDNPDRLAAVLRENERLHAENTDLRRALEASRRQEAESRRAHEGLSAWIQGMVRGGAMITGLEELPEETQHGGSLPVAEPGRGPHSSFD